MDEKGVRVPFSWTEEFTGGVCPPMPTKRKYKLKKIRFYGWGSKPLIEFLESIGKDTHEKLSQDDVTSIIDEYVREKDLLHPGKKKRVLCDEKLHTLFGRKSVGRIKIYDLLESHFAENQEQSDSGDEFVTYQETKEPTSMKILGQPNVSNSDEKARQKRNNLQNYKSIFAAIRSENLKLVYLKRSLVQDLLKEPGSFETKMIGSFVRVKSDPNDYFSTNPHQLLPVAGVTLGDGDSGSETLLKVSNLVKDVPVHMLSDDNFTEEECVDLRQRVEEGLLKRPTIVELEEKAQILHADITNHWIVRELALLHNLITRANEKGWRRELSEYLEKRKLLQTPSEQSRLLHESPKVIVDELVLEAKPQSYADNMKDGNFGSRASVKCQASKILEPASTAKETVKIEISAQADAAGHQPHMNPESDERPEGIKERQAGETPVVQLSSDEEEEDGGGRRNQGGMECDADPGDLDAGGEKNQASWVLQASIFKWHYMDPDGKVQGPFAVEALREWSTAGYFEPDFKVWKKGETQKEAILLTDLLSHS